MQQQTPKVRLCMESVILAASGKNGRLTPDADGYYTVNLGAYNAYNAVGQYYDYESARKFFDPDHPMGIAQRMSSKGVLRGEAKHPMPNPGESQAAYLMRLRGIDSDRVSHHIRRVWLVESRDEKGRPIIQVVGEVRPYEGNEFGRTLKESLDNPHENTYFSVRSIVVDDTLRSIRYTRELITWDWVPEGGIYTASKHHTAGLESIELMEITRDIAYEAEYLYKQRAAVGNESFVYAGMGSYIEEMGWRKTKPVTKEMPSYLDWM